MTTQAERIKRLTVKCPCCAGRGKVRLETRSPAASTNELATAVEGVGPEWLEYDSAAEWSAARGLSGAVGSRLPENISSKCAELIADDTEAFERRVREMAYARAMREIAE